MSTVADRVSAGIKLLDENVEGWRDKIDMPTLDIRNTRSCVLGQIFKTDSASWESGYDRGREVLGLNACGCCPERNGQKDPYDYGFDAKFQLTKVEEQFTELQAEWERQLSLVLA